MFEGSESLKIIDFPNLDLTKVNEKNLKDVFLNCTNLEYINLNLSIVVFEGCIGDLKKRK